MQKQIFPDHEKTRPPYMNIENFVKGKVTTKKSVVLKSCRILDFHSEYYIPEIEKLDFHLPHVYIFGKKYCAINKSQQLKKRLL